MTVCGLSIHPSISWMNSDAGPRSSYWGWRVDGFVMMDRSPHGQNRTLDQDYDFSVDEWTVFQPWSVHLMNGFGRCTEKIILRWRNGRISRHEIEFVDLWRRVFDFHIMKYNRYIAGINTRYIHSMELNSHHLLDCL